MEWESGRVLGKHQGYWYYTLGQRKGLRLGGGPWFVVKKDVQTNTVFVSLDIDNPEQLCNASEFALQGWHELAPVSDAPLPIFFKIRHSPDFEEGMFSYSEQLGHYVVKSNRTLKGVAPGQFAVIYVPYKDGRKICIGSGEIM